MLQPKVGLSYNTNRNNMQKDPLSCVTQLTGRKLW